MNEFFKREETLDDEIDLYELWLVLKRRKFYVFGFLILFSVAGLLYAFLSPEVYRNSALVALPSVELKNGERREIVSFSTTTSILKLLGDELQKGEYDKLARELQLPLSVVKSLDSLTVSSTERRESGKRVFLVELDGREPSLLPKVLSSLVNYLNSNPFVSKQIEEQRRIIKQQLQEIGRELPKLENEVKLLKEKILKSQIKVLGFDPTAIDRNLILMRAKKLNLEYILSAGIHGYEVVYSTVSGKPVKPNRPLVVAVSAVTGLFFGIFVAFFVEWLENARRRFSGAPQR